MIVALFQQTLLPVLCNQELQSGQAALFQWFAALPVSPDKEAACVKSLKLAQL
jgi:hypothetical protein